MALVWFNISVIKLLTRKLLSGKVLDFWRIHNQDVTCRDVVEQ